MSEEDVLYRSEERESEDHVIERAISVLDRIFDVMDDTCTPVSDLESPCR